MGPAVTATALYSYWTAPEGGGHCGWNTAADRDAGWMLSVLLARRHFDHVVVVADEPGRAMVERLELPVDELLPFESDISGFDPLVWSVGKLDAVRQMLPRLDAGETVAHLDHDLFLLGDGLVAQLAETETALFQDEEPIKESFFRFYRSMRQVLDMAALGGQVDLPPSWRAVPSAFNCGVIGLRPSAAEFARRWTEEGLALAREITRIAPIAARVPHCWTIMPEQYVAACVADAMGIRPSVLFENGSGYAAPSNGLGYVHLLAGSKRVSALAARVHRRLVADFPQAARLHSRLHPN